MADRRSTYRHGFGITAILVFVTAWLYSIATYGYLLGVGLGWVPAAITAVLVAAIWPVAVLALLGLATWVLLLAG